MGKKAKGMTFGAESVRAILGGTKTIDYMRTASEDEIIVMICAKFPDKVDSTKRIRNFFSEELSQEQIEDIRSFTAFGKGENDE